MADKTTHLDQIEDGAGATVRVNELADAMSPLSLMGRRAETTTGLVWGYYGGRVNGTAKANGTVALTDDATNYVVMHRTTLVVTAATNTTNWDDVSTYARMYKVTVASSVVTDYEDHRMGSLFQLVGSAVLQPIELQFACSDLGTSLSAATGVGYVRAPDAFTLTAVRASLLTASTSGIVTIDINVGGATILSTKLTIDQDEKTSTTAATAAVISSASIADDAEITVDIDGAGTGAKGLVVTLIGVRT